MKRDVWKDVSWIALIDLPGLFENPDWADDRQFFLFAFYDADHAEDSHEEEYTDPAVIDEIIEYAQDKHIRQFAVDLKDYPPKDLDDEDDEPLISMESDETVAFGAKDWNED